MNALKHPLKTVWIAAIVLSLASCSAVILPNASSATPGSGITVDLQLGGLASSARALSDDGSVTSVTVAVTNDSGTSIGSGALAKSGSAWKGFLSLSETGNVTFTALAKDSVGGVLYRGATTTTISGSGQSVAIGVVAAAWQTVGSAGFSADGTNYTSLAIDGVGTSYVAYSDWAEDYKASVMKFNGSAWVQVGGPGFSPAEAAYTSIAIGTGAPYVAYRDAANSYKASVMMFDDTDWVQVGIAGFSAGEADNVSLAIGSSGTPYVAYTDVGHGSKASVMKFNGTSWEQVGIAGFSQGEAGYTSLAFDSQGAPYVAFEDSAYGDKIIVQKFDGSTWEQVEGNSDISEADASYVSLAIDGSDTPYVAYKDFGSSSGSYGGVSVVKYDGTEWVQVGNPRFSANEADYISLVVDGSGTPYVAFEDYFNNAKASVMKFSGSSWVPVGGAGFTAAGIQHASLAVNASGTLYLAFQDGSSAGKASVMKFY